MKKKIIVLVCTGLLISCSSSSNEDSGTGQNSNNPPTDSESGSGNVTWSIPQSQVLDGGPGKDGIPALVNPNFVNIQSINYLNDTDFVLGFKQGEDVRAYPHAILDWHEIVNDNIGSVSVAVTYCPLTGTGIGWNRILKGKETTFGVSGLLYNTNLIPYDRETNSNWSQILNESVNGTLLGEKADLIQLFETDWKTWKALYPNSKVLSNNTGFSRTYGISPYGDYNTNNNRFLFPVPKDPRMPSKERVLAIVDGDDSKAYRFSSFISQNIIKDSFKSKNYMLVGNPNFIVSFELDANTEELIFEYVYNGSEILLKDNEGSEWNVFGEAVSGPRMGEFLKPAPAFMAFWFSVPAFYITDIYVN
ncbi:MAG: DUF3179 domain-containing protein [Flavobacteriales bacterium]|nr:DUF3179 domain-containing protein [Flavobacteriia bacterium]NCP04884.1 DUF3179 domain-containing protein [Flavobacteriales bacterium]PIV95237.1 MAG: hypothetical protein COW44_00265 [Flavobacteriaceae bacterium CG17_big_fil_post_rev_8_21_14_2_50_33_15]PIY11683.1 MAG: hypothetical protein COZ17_05885 [Flavobacteriaceae bacterium CG_4_10_14_3_um_filter_33_47]PJB16932.1 MAG: hypothetical protein CO117_13365 [Flavobacteriaceae bacterium CG_4_9_14_3_um_filter_33_16]